MIIFLLILALFAVKPYLGLNFPYTHDGENHLARFANYKLALKEGQLPPRFAPNLLNHYGYPVFNYNYPLANILSLPFSILKINYELTFKVLVFSFLVFGLIGVNKWLKQLNFSQRSRVLTLFAFAFSPYLVNLIYFRGNIGEIMALMIFPWLLYFIQKPNSESLRKNTLALFGQTIVWTMFFLSHNIMVLFGTPLLICWAIFEKRKAIYKQTRLIFGFGAGVLLSLWFWLPAVLEKSLVVLENADLSKSYLEHFPTLAQLLFSPQQFGFSLPGSVDTLSFQIGAIFLISLLLATITIKFSKTNQVKFFIFLTWILIIFQLPFTKAIWQAIPLANFIQFPWRLTFFVTIFALPIAAWTLDHLGKKAKLLLWILILVQVFNTLKLKPADYFHRDLLTYDLYPASTSTANENLPTDFTFEYFADGDWKSQPTILEGNGEVIIEKWNGSQRKYQLNLTQESLITEPTAKFAGWQTFANQQKIDYIDSASIGGRLAYKLSSGEYQIVSKFTQDTKPRQIGNWLSLTSLLVVISLIGYSKFNEYKK